MRKQTLALAVAVFGPCLALGIWLSAAALTPRVSVTVATVPCSADPLRQAFPKMLAGGAQLIGSPVRDLDGSFTFTLMVRPGLRSIALNSNNCRAQKTFVVLESTARHISLPLLPYPGGHARQAAPMRRDTSIPVGALAGLLPIPNLSAQVDDGHGRTFGAEYDSLAYYVDQLLPGKYFLTVTGEGYRGRFAIEVQPGAVTRQDVPMTDLTPGY